jgi:hypothetical protein
MVCLLRKELCIARIKNLFSQSTDNAVLEEELRNMARLASYYSRFIDPSKEGNPEVSRSLIAFQELDVTTCYPLLLRLFDLQAQEAVSEEDFKKCLSLIESFVVRRAICLVPTNSLSKIFMQWSKELREGDVVSWLGTKMASGSGNTRWPNDATFKNAIQTIEQYGRSRKATRHVLVSIERGFHHKEPADLASATIEHVMPQELSPDWREMLGVRCDDVHESLLHTFGNLTLTAYNSELGNLSFDIKRQKLSTSHIELNRWICSQTEWNKQIIEYRSELLAEAALELWLGPERFF